MIIEVPAEIKEEERRVGLIPEGVADLKGVFKQLPDVLLTAFPTPS